MGLAKEKIKTNIQKLIEFLSSNVKEFYSLEEISVTTGISTVSLYDTIKYRHRYMLFKMYKEKGLFIYRTSLMTFVNTLQKSIS